MLHDKDTSNELIRISIVHLDHVGVLFSFLLYGVGGKS